MEADLGAGCMLATRANIRILAPWSGSLACGEKSHQHYRPYQHYLERFIRQAAGPFAGRQVVGTTIEGLSAAYQLHSISSGCLSRA